MPLTQYRPQFPYTGNQVIISSDRVLLHSKADSIFLFGKTAVGISTPATLNVDANIGTTINSPTIELGLNAKETGEPVHRGKALNTQLGRVLSALSTLSAALANLKSNPEDLAASIPPIQNAATILQGVVDDVAGAGGNPGKLDTTLSNTTFTL